MSAETLRRAAVLMRERAEAARTFYSEPHAKAGQEVPWFGPADMYDFDDHDGPHIASWHPAVALAVADTLDALAKVLDEGDYTVESDVLPTWLHCYLDNIAATYLGESA